MNAILNRQDEAQWALIAQTLKPCTPKIQLALIDQMGSFRQLFESRDSVDNPALDQQLQIIRKAYHAGQWQTEVDKIGKTLDQYQAKIIPITSEDYPPQLQQIAKPPPLRYIRGNPHCLHLPQLAIVGSRRMTRGAEIIAHSWAKKLHELEISSKGLTDHNVEALANGIKNKGYLCPSTIDFGFNEISISGAKILVDAIQAGCDKKVETLNLSGNFSHKAAKSIIDKYADYVRIQVY